MNFIKENIIGLVAIVIAIVGLFSPAAQQAVKTAFGGVTNYDEVDATAIKIGGSSGSRVGPIIATTCNLQNADTSITATTTGYVYCSVTGVVSGDTVMVQLATSTAVTSTVLKNWVVSGARASTTAGFIDISLTNNTGGNVAPSALNVGSSTNVLIFHPVTSVPGL